ncbi:hypothetical protein Tco_1269361 [Tanacetum coccineum]
MEEASLYTTRKHLFISTQYYDKHGVPPTKRLAFVNRGQQVDRPRIIGTMGKQDTFRLRISGSIEVKFPGSGSTLNLKHFKIRGDIYVERVHGESPHEKGYLLSEEETDYLKGSR